MMTEKKWDVVIGLEIHAQLNTITKLFCSCPTSFGMPSNTNVCEICLGHPGVLPVLNEKAVENAIKVGLAIEADIKKFSEFERKNYFYPDLPKAYQITQLMHPICERGKIKLIIKDDKNPDNNYEKYIRINRIQLEEDAGKLMHSEVKEVKESYVDLNRAGTPLIEIVSEPDLSTPEEAVEYLKTVRNLLLYLEVSDCNMQEGSLRCDANVSIKPSGSKTLGIRTEVKNMNTFKGIHAAISYEIKRQTRLKELGQDVLQQTLLFDSDKKETQAMRSKEEAQDYRYFLDPDLIPLRLSDSFISNLKSNLPELPQEKQLRFKQNYGLSDYDVWLFVSDRDLADYYEEAVKYVPESPKKVCNWISTEVLSYLNKELITISDFHIPAKEIGDLVKLQNQGKISGKISKTIFKEMLMDKANCKKVVDIVKEKNLSVVSDEGEIKGIIDKIIIQNIKVVKKYQDGNTKVFGFFVGQVMQATKGQANPEVVNRLLKQELDKK